MNPIANLSNGEKVNVSLLRPGARKARICDLTTSVLSMVLAVQASTIMKEK